MSTPIVTRLHPSPELEAQGLGLPTTAAAVSRVVNAAGYEYALVRQRHNHVIVFAALHHEAVLRLLTRKGYAAERSSRGDKAIAVYGRRKTTRQHLDPATYVPHQANA